MKLSINFISLITSILVSQAGFAALQPITDYQQLLTTLKEGQTVRAVIDLEKCTGKDKTTQSPKVIGAMNFTQFNQHQIKQNDQMTTVIATSINMLVESAKEGFNYNYVRLRVFENNSAQVYSAFLNVKDFKPNRESTFECKLSDEKNGAGVTLYRL